MRELGRRRRNLLLGGATAFAALAGTALLLRPPPPPERVILIVVDTLRRDFLSPYGSDNATPHIQALAARGQVFSNASASFHQTSMSMGSLFTGRTPSIETEDPRHAVPWNSSTWCGLARFAEPGETSSCIPSGVPTLGERIREAGYWTIGVVSNPFLFEPSGFGRGFDDWVEVGESGWEAAIASISRRTATQVNRAAAQALKRRRSDRFFLYVHYMDVHDYTLPVAKADWDAETGARVYAEAVRRVDAGVGRLLADLEGEGLLAGARVIFTSDHGERLGERHLGRGRGKLLGHLGNPSFEELLRIPLIVAPPLDRDVSALVRSEDLFHLVQAIAGVPSRPATPLRPEEVFLGELYFLTYRDARWKSTVRRADEALLLFDLAEDPRETRDFADERGDVVAAHRRRIAALSRQLATRTLPKPGDAADDRRRLRALGYLEE